MSKTLDDLGIVLKEKKIFEMDYEDFDRIVASFYGFDFDFVSDVEGLNDSTKCFIVDGVVEDSYDEGQLTRFLNGEKTSGMSSILLNDLCRKGVIPVGEYNIEICW